MSLLLWRWTVTLIVFGLILNLIRTDILLVFTVWMVWFVVSALIGIFVGSWIFGWLDSE